MNLEIIKSGDGTYVVEIETEVVCTLEELHLIFERLKNFSPDEKDNRHVILDLEEENMVLEGHCLVGPVYTLHRETLSLQDFLALSDWEIRQKLDALVQAAEAEHRTYQQFGA